MIVLESRQRKGGGVALEKVDHSTVDIKPPRWFIS